MKNEIVIIKWKAGLHARPASEIVKIANKFTSKITIYKGDIQVDGKSVISIMTLGAPYLTSLTISAEGEDEEIALKEIRKIFEIEDVG